VSSLLNKTSKFINGDEEGFVSQVLDDIKDKIEAPGGPTLLFLLGYVYQQEAKQHLGRYLGMERLWARVQETGHTIKEGLRATMSAFETELEVRRAQQDLQNGSVVSPDQVEAVQKRILEKGLDTVWRVGQLEIESTVRDVCECVMEDASINKKTSHLRTQAIKKLGSLYFKAGKQAKKSQKEHLQRFVKEKEAFLWA